MCFVTVCVDLFVIVSLMCSLFICRKMALGASDPNPNANYILADGIVIPHKGYNQLVGVTDEDYETALKASVADVGRPWMSVAQIVQNGSNTRIISRLALADGRLASSQATG